MIDETPVAPRSARRWIKPTLWGLLVALVLYFVLFGGEYSIFAYRQLDAQRKEREQELVVQQHTIDSLKTRINVLQTSDTAIERIARENYGYVKAGEKLYRFITPHDSVKKP